MGCSIFCACEYQTRELVAHVGHQSHITGTLDGNRQLTLMESTGTGHTAGNDLSALAHVLAQAGQILVINVLNAIDAEASNLFAAAVHRAGRTIHSHCGNLLID